MAAITIRLNYNFGSSVQCCTLQAIRVVCETSLDRNVFREKLHVIYPWILAWKNRGEKKRICSYRYKTKIGAVFVLWFFILIIKVFCNFSPSLALPTSGKIVVTKIPGTAQNSQVSKKEP